MSALSRNAVIKKNNQSSSYASSTALVSTSGASSYSALGTVIGGNGAKPVQLKPVPYRNSKLTHLLKVSSVGMKEMWTVTGRAVSNTHRPSDTDPLFSASFYSSLMMCVRFFVRSTSTGFSWGQRKDCDDHHRQTDTSLLPAVSRLIVICVQSEEHHQHTHTQ